MMVEFFKEIFFVCCWWLTSVGISDVLLVSAANRSGSLGVEEIAKVFQSLGTLLQKPLTVLWLSCLMGVSFFFFFFVFLFGFAKDTLWISSKFAAS